MCVCVITSELFNHWSTCTSISHEGLKWTGYGSHWDSDHFFGYRRINNAFIVSEKSSLNPHSTSYWLHSCVFSCQKKKPSFAEFIEKVSLRIHGRDGGPAWQTTETRPSRAQPGSPRNILLRTPCSPHHTLAPSCCSCESSWLPALWTAPSTSKTLMEASSQHTQAAGPCLAARSWKTKYLTS